MLFGFWLLLSGHYTPFLVGVGLATAILVAAGGLLLGYADREGHPVELTLRGLLYWPWLIKEIVMSAVNVSWVILQPSLPISPRLIEVDTPQEGPVGVVVYANSITLTPATITVHVDRSRRKLLVHALTAGSAAGLATGEMSRRVSAMAGDV